MTEVKLKCTSHAGQAKKIKGDLPVKYLQLR